MAVGSPQQSPRSSHRSQGVHGRREHAGAIALPEDTGQTTADDESSTKGPAGFELVAREMQNAVLGPGPGLWNAVGRRWVPRQSSGRVAGVE